MLRKAFKDFTIAFDAPENKKEFRSVVDMLEHEAADGLRALAAGLRVEHATVDELREIEDGIRRLETEEREAADPVRADSPYPRLIRETRGYACARAHRPTAILQCAQRPPVALHFNPRLGNVITRGTWSSSASASLESSSPEPLTPYDNDDHDAYRADNKYFTAEELEIRNFYKSISPRDWSPAISDWALNEQYLPGSRSSSNLEGDHSREDAEAAAEFPQPDFSPRLGPRDHRSEHIRLELQSWTYECNAHRLTHLQHEDEMGSEPANAALRALHGPLSNLPMTARLPVSAECSTQAGQSYEEEGSAGQVVSTLESGADAGKAGCRRRVRNATKGGDEAEVVRWRSSGGGGPRWDEEAQESEDKSPVGLAGDRLATGGYGLAPTRSYRHEQLRGWEFVSRFFPSRYLHHPLLFDLEVAKMQTIWSILQRNRHVHLADKLHELLSIRLRNEYVVSHVLNAGYLDFNYPEGEVNYWDLLEDPDNVSTHHRTFSADQVYEHSEAEGRLSDGDDVSDSSSYGGLQYPATDDKSSDEECHHHGPDRCRRCGKHLAVSCPTLADPGTNALGLTL
ncbi:hypothetical protein B0H14DRAFT_3167787 [Mycena olivaceomarginata]|nr:hypothetical protein B0H14DRAFT_3167787 [Mycena olivaceomarginata]